MKTKKLFRTLAALALACASFGLVGCGFVEGIVDATLGPDFLMSVGNHHINRIQVRANGRDVENGVIPANTSQEIGVNVHYTNDSPGYNYTYNRSAAIAVDAKDLVTGKLSATKYTYASTNGAYLNRVDFYSQDFR